MPQVVHLVAMPRNQDVRRRQIAFTLVELLVVVAIIALLISILLPSMRAARESGKQTYCLSNMRQVAMIVLEYAIENDDYLMREIGVHEAPDWTEEVRKRLNDNDHTPFADVGVFQCPSFPTPDPSLLFPSHRSEPPLEQHLDYVTNGWGVDGGTQRIENSLTRIRRPAELVYLTEGSRYLPLIEVAIILPSGRPASLHDIWHEGHLPGSDNGAGRVWFLRIRTARDRHNKRVNVVHMDGHGSSYRTEKLTDLKLWIDEYPLD